MQYWYITRSVVLLLIVSDIFVFCLVVATIWRNPFSKAHFIRKFVIFISDFVNKLLGNSKLKTALLKSEDLELCQSCITGEICDLKQSTVTGIKYIGEALSGNVNILLQKQIRFMHFDQVGNCDFSSTQPFIIFYSKLYVFGL